MIPITVAILVGLFLIQRHGTARSGGLFGPVILVWLGFLAVTGAVQLAHTPQVLSAVFPWHAVRFLVFNKLHGFIVLGAVFLVVTGTEALYADMGHFGPRPIRLTWFAIVFPALVLNYFGQGALLLVNPEAVRHPFYAMVPAWAMIPTVLLATLSTISKILHGAWFPLVIGVVFFTLMLTWAKGRWLLAAKLHEIMPPVHKFIVDLDSHPPNKIDGDGVFLTGNGNAVPVALVKNVKHNNALHSRTILLQFRVEDIPRVPNLEKVKTEKLTGGFHRIVARYGFMEDPTLDKVLTLLRGQGLDLDPETTSFYVGRENLVIAGTSAMMRWRANLFNFMSRNAADATSFFNLPADQTIEVGVRLEI